MIDTVSGIKILIHTEKNVFRNSAKIACYFFGLPVVKENVGPPKKNYALNLCDLLFRKCLPNFSDWKSQISDFTEFGGIPLEIEICPFLEKLMSISWHFAKTSFE